LEEDEALQIAVHWISASALLALNNSNSNS